MIKIIENYNSNGYWYKKYSNGIIEQGGYIATTIATSGSYNLTFPTEFSNAPLCFRTTVYAPRSGDSSGNALTVKNGTMTTTGVTLLNDGYNTNKLGFYWEAMGYYAA